MFSANLAVRAGAGALVRRGIAGGIGAGRLVHVEAKLDELGYKLPKVSPPRGSYTLAVRSGNLLFTAGHLPVPATGEMLKGKIGKELTREQGQQAAQACALNIIATLKAELGDLDRVARVVKLTCFVNAVNGYSAQPSVANGASDLVREVFGPEVGTHARSAVGSNGLPLDVPVEVEAVVEVRD